MKIFNYKNIMIALSVLVMGCDRDELLDIEPFGQVIPTTVDEFRQVLDQRSNTGANWWGTAPMYEVDFYLSDEIQIPDGTYNSYVGFSGERRLADAAIWAEFFGADQEDDNDWIAQYNKIYVCNLVTENLNDPEITGDESLRQQLLAEANVHRAFAYWGLVNLYAKQYDAATASTDLGVPIKLESNFSNNTPRASVQAVYDLILEELNTAISGGALPAGRQDISTRPSMSAAYAILAKTHLAMGNYQEALTAADNALQNYSTLTDFNMAPFLPQNFNNQELIMLKEFGVSYISQGTTHFASDELMALYGPNDTRPNVYFSRDFVTQAFVISRRPWENNNFMGPTVAEMYLVRAECNARVGDLAAVEDDLNTILQNRVSGHTPLAEYTDRAVALTEVKTERRKELVSRGVRLFDLKRYNAYDNDNITLTRTFDGTTYTLEPNSNRWVVPIARSITLQSPEIEQNPR